MTWLSDGLLLGRKDLVVELRAGQGIALSFALTLIALVVVGLATGPEPTRLRDFAPAIVWTTFLYAVLAVADRLDRIDRDDDAAAGLWLVLEDRRSLFLGRIISLSTCLTALQVTTWAVATILLDLELTVGMLALVPAAVVTSIAAATAAALIGPIIADLNHRSLLLPVALLPLLVPTFLAGVQAASAVLDGRSSDALGWIAALAIEGALLVGLGLLVFEAAAGPE